MLTSVQDGSNQPFPGFIHHVLQSEKLLYPTDYFRESANFNGRTNDRNSEAPKNGEQRFYLGNISEPLTAQDREKTGISVPNSVDKLINEDDWTIFPKPHSLLPPSMSASNARPFAVPRNS